MFSFLRPYIFNLDPETAHDLAIKSLKIDLIPETFFNIPGEDLLEVNVFDKSFKNPIGLAAGFDKSAEVYNSLFKLGFGFVEVGTITPKRQFGNPKPRVFRLEKDNALINRLGFNNDGVDEVQKRLMRNQARGILGINVGPNKSTKNKEEDYIICIKQLHNFADYITINISSPNTEDLRKFHEKENFFNLLKNIQKTKTENNFKKPFLIKISPDIVENDISHIIELSLRFKIDGIIISNTTDKNRSNLTDKNKDEIGGLSGKPINGLSNKLIKRFYKETKGKLTIIGVGGIDSGSCVFEKLTSGASLVQLYTGLIYKGPSIVKDIKSELINILKREKITKLSDIIGSSSK